jgi:hypothetical protein
MAKGRGPVAAWSFSVATVSGGFASYVSTRVKSPLHSPLFLVLAGIAVLFFVILVSAGIPDLVTWLGSLVREVRLPERRPPRLITDRWQYIDNSETSAFTTWPLSSAMQSSLPGTGSPDTRAPWVRLVVVLACSPAEGNREALLPLLAAFLAEPLPMGLIRALTYVKEGVSWRKWHEGGIGTKLSLASGKQDEAAASAEMFLTRAGTLDGPYGSYAVLVIHTDPRDINGEPAPAASLANWSERIIQALHLTEAFGRFVSGELGLRTWGKPPAQLAVRFQAQRDLTEIFDIEGLELLPEGTRQSQALGLFMADRRGKQAAEAADWMIARLRQNALNVQR